MVATARYQDQINGGAGDDIYRVDVADLVVTGGDGSDTLDFTAYYPDPPYRVNLGASTGQVSFYDGSAWQLRTWTGFENAIFGNGDDTFTGNAAANQVIAGAGNDVLTSDFSYDLVAHDFFDGGTGRETIYVYHANVDVDGGTDWDTVYLNSRSNVAIDLRLTDHNVTTYLPTGAISTTWNNVEWIVFNASTDASGAISSLTFQGGTTGESVDGGYGADILRGNIGNDYLYGNGGDDVLDGGEGNDVLYGQAGNDAITGGLGSDMVGYSTTTGATYSITTQTDGTILITESDTGYVDSVSGVERLDVSTKTGATWSYKTTSIQSPVILDIDGDGIHLTANDGTTSFDMDMDGIKDLTGWFTSGDAILFADRNHDGDVQGTEISFTDESRGALTDMAGLRLQDSNHDGILDASDPFFAELMLWKDDGDAILQFGEIVSLGEAGISSIGLSTIEHGGSFAMGENIIFGDGSFQYSDGRQGDLIDAGLAYTPSIQPDYQMHYDMGFMI